ncbi:MAG TPA: hypothetical protein VE685_09295, partial [Thermoanaerobaculia bacterium]|nr:hypothetical protein [Thermoanaerobaculia bacterium]
MRPFPALLIACCLAKLASAPMAAQSGKKLTVEEVFATGATGRQASQASWSPDGTRLTYVWDEKGDGKEEALWSL